ncbi:hypothetical protein D3877_10520 [Azospirillum cavernae]|uniref:Uncharacterized protein n=1 Tax=Azospirillum cavernae TaxID=2320860 RepID=A0A418W4E6_9PROT|nr:hypothetical protein [Azospirillum cavernae]RJF84900.1 hypothetical protein D3877_10520 [Azospirillum cavernae]
MSSSARKGPIPTRQLHCACCGRPFVRPSLRGPAPLYCSPDCQKQMRVRSRVWSLSQGETAPAPRRARALLKAS